MSKDLPATSDGGQPRAERSKLENLEKKRQATLDELKGLLDEEQRLIAAPTSDVSLDRLFAINRAEAGLIERLREIELQIEAEQKEA